MLKQKLSLIRLTLLSISGLAILYLLLPISVNAQNNANEYCKKYDKSSQRDACEVGFNGGKTESGNACARASGADRNACEDGYRKSSGDKNFGQHQGSANQESIDTKKCKKSNNPQSCDSDYKQCEELYADDKKAIKDCQDDVLTRYGTLENQCGKGEDAIRTRFDFGCIGDRLPDRFSSPIYDLAFAVIRFLTAGVGIVVVIMIIIAGIQYTTSEGNPEATMQAKSKIQSALIALVIYIFLFAIIQYLVPGGVFN